MSFTKQINAGAFQQLNDDLFDRFQETEPKRSKLSSEDSSFIARFIRENSKSIIPNETGIMRFHAHADLLPDGHPIIVTEGKASNKGLHFPIVRGSMFGAYIKLIIHSKNEPLITAIIPETTELMPDQRSAAEDIPSSWQHLAKMTDIGPLP